MELTEKNVSIILFDYKDEDAEDRKCEMVNEGRRAVWEVDIIAIQNWVSLQQAMVEGVESMI